MTFSYLRASSLYLSPVPQPRACTKSVNSWFPRSFSADALATFKILPLRGRIACVILFRACFAEPPAESPSTINISVPTAPFLLQSVNFPGRRNFLVADFLLTSFCCFRRSLSSLLSTKLFMSNLAVSGEPDSQ